MMVSRHPRPDLLAIGLLLVVGRLLLAGPADGAAPAREAATPDFQRHVLPLLQSHCTRCHGPRKQEAGLRLDTLSTDLVGDRAAAEHWQAVLHALNSGQMPPEGEPPLSEAQRETVIRWVGATIQQALTAERSTGGQVVLRRLNRAEYQHTMSDLLGVSMDYTRDLPPDPVSADGFRNNGQSLGMSALQLESFLQTARRGLARVIQSGPAPRQYHHRFQEGNVRQWLGKPEFSNHLGRQQEFLARMEKEYPERGPFLIRVKVRAELPPDTGYPLLEVGVGYRPDTKILFREFEPVELTSAEEQMLEFRGDIEDFPLPVRGQGKFPGLVIRIRNLYDDGSPRPAALKPAGDQQRKDKSRGTIYPPEPHLPAVTVLSVEFHGPVFERWPPAAHRRILFDSPRRASDESGYLEEVLRQFLRRAYRRPVHDQDVEPLVAFFHAVRGEFPTFEEAVSETLALALIRPEFLFLVEPGAGRRRLTEHELAARLSYFLWSTMPDAQLSAAADENQLGATLPTQVDRLLGDPRSSRFIRQFTTEWLQLDRVERVAISREFHPEFNDSLKAAMQAETQEFFGELVRHNLSALRLLDSDFTMLNEPLARHYGVPDVRGHWFRRVGLTPAMHRGGLLGQASILLANSTGSDSHAVRRAVWIRDRLLGDPPAPPPPDVPALDEANPKFHELSIREQLALHRGQGACAACHRSIDPWGIALEHFDAVGRWRDTIRRRQGKRFTSVPVECQDSLPGGIVLDGAEQLKQHLLTARKPDFARSLVARLTSYALGRELEFHDTPAIDRLAEQFAASDYRLRDLLQQIVASELFQSK